MYSLVNLLCSFPSVSHHPDSALQRPLSLLSMVDQHIHLEQLRRSLSSCILLMNPFKKQSWRTHISAVPAHLALPELTLTACVVQ